MAILEHTSYHIMVTPIANYQTKCLVSNTKNQARLSGKKWFEQVKNPVTGEFFQLEVLRAVGTVPAGFRKDEKPRKYPA
jgi:hypothetical protein